MALTYDNARELLARQGQEHLLRFWGQLDETQRATLLQQIDAIEFPLMDRLIKTWVHTTPAPELFSKIQPVPLIPKIDPARPEALEAGEAALRQGRVGLFLVAGGQGTRLGFPGAKGTYPIGPVSQKSFFQFHAEKIHNLQNRYACTLPWYIMVSDINEAETRAFFAQHNHFGLNPANIAFLRQRMVPCVNDEGLFLLAEPGLIATNPNGHGGCIPAMVENGVIDDARRRGVDVLSYFQVDNWAVKVADPYFIGYHVLRNAEMSSKNHLKNDLREAVGVHCICDGQYRVIEYSELDIYPQLLDTTPDGAIIHSAGNPAIHILSVDFVQRVYNHYDQFPWHLAHKKIPYIDANGRLVQPPKPNGYKFETFVFDALRFTRHQPVALEIDPPGEYTPIKQFDGDNSVVAAWDCMAEYWAKWLEAAGSPIPRTPQGKVAIKIEISPQFALTQEEFTQKAHNRTYTPNPAIAIDPKGEPISAGYQ